MGLLYHQAIVLDMLVRLGGISGGAKILDLGCGTGFFTKCLYELRKGSYTDIIGIDVSPEMLSKNPYRSKYGSAERIPYGHDSFDIVAGRSILHHLKNPGKALEEVKRVLRPNGKYVFWETNKSWIAHQVRKLTQHGDRFSEYHSEFEDLPTLIGHHLKVSNVKYGGFFGYVLFGFPDIVKFHDFLGNFFKHIMALDERLSRSFIKKLGFWVMVSGTK